MRHQGHPAGHQLRRLCADALNVRVAATAAACGAMLWAGMALAAADPDRSKCPAPTPAPSYFTSSQVDLQALLAPPPAADSAQQQADIQGVLDAQRAARLSGATARAIADSEPTCARFKDVLGPQLKSEAAAKALKFVSEAAGAASGASGPPKSYWKRPRPFLVNAEVERLADIAPDGKGSSEEYPPDPNCAAPPPKDAAEAAKQKKEKEKELKRRDNTSYPSGHSAFGTSCAILLSEVFPEKRVELFARARQYGESRLIVGAHFPSDVEAGRIIGTIGTALLMQNAGFERQFYEAQADLRAALGYPAKAPDLEPSKDLFKDEAGSDRGGRSRRGGGPSRGAGAGSRDGGPG